MTFKFFGTYSTTPLGFSGNRFDCPACYGFGRNIGWFVSVCFLWFGKRYVAQVRHDSNPAGLGV
jgi:hypothetical protein